VRQSLASDLGIVLPKVRVRDNLRLSEHRYLIKIAGNVVADAEVPPHQVIAVALTPSEVVLPGGRFSHPIVPEAACAIDPDQIPQAQAAGYTIHEPVALIAQHLQQTVQRLAHELLTRDATRQLIDELAKTAPTVVQELIPDVLKLSEVQQVLQRLLREGIPIRQLARILEALGDWAPHTRDVGELTEQVRRQLARTISSRYREDDGRLHVATLDARLEQTIAESIDRGHRAHPPRLEPPRAKNIGRAIERTVQSLRTAGHHPVLLVSPAIRRTVKKLTLPFVPQLTVLSYDEITQETRVSSLGIVSLDDPA
jgi:flagellar biosynthesis protein FlhA